MKSTRETKQSKSPKPLDKETSGLHTWLVIWKAYEACKGLANKSIEDLGMCYSDFAVLESLLHKGPLPVNTIGEKVSLSSGSITTAVDRLEKRGLVERQYIDSDRRTRLVVLTAAGQKLIKKSFDHHELELEEIVEGLSRKEKETLLLLLKKVGKKARLLTESGAAHR